MTRRTNTACFVCFRNSCGALGASNGLGRGGLTGNYILVKLYCLSLGIGPERCLEQVSHDYDFQTPARTKELKSRSMASSGVFTLLLLDQDYVAEAMRRLLKLLATRHSGRHSGRLLIGECVQEVWVFRK